MLRKILEKPFITKKWSWRKTLYALKVDIFELSGDKNIGELLSKYELFSLDQANFSSDPSHILILQYPIPKASLPPLPSLSNFPPGQLKPFSIQSSSFFSSFSLYFLPHSTTCRNYLIYWTICQAKPIKFIISLYTIHNTLLVKYATCKKLSLLDSLLFQS